MTAEIAVLNRSAVALAADSAVTITTQTGQKIYNTVNKLFALSKYEPVGVMINGGADLVGVPWELVIKLYRQSIGNKAFATVDEAGIDFLQWILDNQSLFPPDLRQAFANATMHMFMDQVIREHLDASVRSKLDGGEALSQQDIRELAHEAAQAIATEIEQQPDTAWCTQEQAADVVASSDFLDIVQTVFENVPLQAETIDLLSEACRLFLTKDFFSAGVTGVVVAGFGTDEAFPAMCHYDIDGFVGDGGRIAKRNSYRVGVDGDASISPFAQREMVDTFISGIAPEYRDSLDGFMAGFLETLVGKVGEEIDDDDLRREVADTIASVGQHAYDRFSSELETFSAERFVAPIVSAVQILPKDELAEMAEALVNLTSFKRRVSLSEVETVGGPIDVAVISKGDGLIWIGRKHYFNPELNPQFAANYYR